MIHLTDLSAEPSQAALSDDEDDAIRTLIQRGLAQGCVSLSDLSLRRGYDDADEDEDGRELQRSSSLLLVLGDLGVIVDDQLPESTARVDVTSSEGGDAPLVDETMEFLSRQWAPEADPLFLYRREIDRTARLSRTEEVQLGAEMEGGLSAAIAALSRWPAGLRVLLSALDDIIAGSRSLESIFDQQTTGGDGSGIDEDAQPAPSPQPPRLRRYGDGGQAEPRGPWSVETAEDLIPIASTLRQHLLELDRSGAERPGAEGPDAGRPDAGRERPSDVVGAVVGLPLSREFLESLVRLSEQTDLTHPARRGLSEGLERTAAAWRTMCEMNLRVVLDFVDRYAHDGMPVLDRIQEGNIGLMKAVEKFEYRRGFRLFAYASWWIRQAISRAVADKARVVRVPVHMIDRISQLTRARELLEERFGRAPDASEIAAHLDLSPSQIERAIAAEPEPQSLEVLSQDEQRAPALLDASETAEEALIRSAQRETIGAVLKTLKPREADVIRLRFGLDSRNEHTLEDIGQMFGLTRERIRQIEAQALGRLRHPVRAQRLASVWYGSPGVGLSAARTRPGTS